MLGYAQGPKTSVYIDLDVKLLHLFVKRHRKPHQIP